jgi:hypothetical protein
MVSVLMRASQVWRQQTVRPELIYYGNRAATLVNP